MSKQAKNFVHKNKPEPTEEEKAQGHTAPRPVAISLRQQLAELMYYSDPKIIDGVKLNFSQLSGAEQNHFVEDAGTFLEALEKMNLMVTAKRDVIAEHDKKMQNKEHLVRVITDFNAVLKKQHKDPKRPFNLMLYPVEELALKILE